MLMEAFVDVARARLESLHLWYRCRRFNWKSNSATTLTQVFELAHPKIYIICTLLKVERLTLCHISLYPGPMGSDLVSEEC